MLRANHISVQIGAHRLLDNFSAQFAHAETVMVVGPNGAGKTTLLRCLDGELTPTAGDVELDGREISQWPRIELARRRAVLPQISTLDFPFSVRDVVLMGRMPHRTSEQQNREIADEAMAQCDCAQFADRAYTSLSGGEQQRVQTARVLAQIHAAAQPLEELGARYLLLDEPASALDLSRQYALLHLLKRLAAHEKIGVVCTMHNLNLVAQFADRALIIDRGMLVADGTPRDIFTEETLGHVFNLDVAVHQHPDNAAIPLLIPKLEK